MKLPTRASYSVRLMVYLADHSRPGQPVGLREISKSQGISLRYLEQLVVPLKNADLIKAVSGKGGGYFLIKDPTEVQIGQIIEIAIGRIRLKDCIDKNFECKFLDQCKAREMWSDINSRITAILYDYNLSDLSEKKLKESLNGHDPSELLPC